MILRAIDRGAGRKIRKTWGSVATVASERMTPGNFGTADAAAAPIAAGCSLAWGTLSIERRLPTGPSMDLEPIVDSSEPSTLS